jgi:pre-mRNA-splicing factor CWC22
VDDMTEQDLKNLRRKIYLTIMNSLDFEDCVHKMVKSGLGVN